MSTRLRVVHLSRQAVWQQQQGPRLCHSHLLLHLLPCSLLQLLTMTRHFSLIMEMVSHHSCPGPPSAFRDKPAMARLPLLTSTTYVHHQGLPCTGLVLLQW
jgi:hypothetical protein